jgi:hypothetical protein
VSDYTPSASAREIADSWRGRCVGGDDVKMLAEQFDDFAARLVAERDAEIATLRERLEWRDISTAPKDGTPIWLLTKAYADPGDPPIFHPARCSIGKWNPDGNSWTDEYGSLDGEDVCQLTVTGVWASGGGWFQPNEVTHWQPLPTLLPTTPARVSEREKFVRLVANRIVQEECSFYDSKMSSVTAWQIAEYAVDLILAPAVPKESERVQNWTAFCETHGIYTARMVGQACPTCMKSVAPAVPAHTTDAMERARKAWLGISWGTQMTWPQAEIDKVLIAFAAAITSAVEQAEERWLHGWCDECHVYHRTESIYRACLREWPAEPPIPYRERIETDKITAVEQERQRLLPAEPREDLILTIAKAICGQRWSHLNAGEEEREKGRARALYEAIRSRPAEPPDTKGGE